MHFGVRKFVEELKRSGIYPEFDRGWTLEIGSRNINGSIRHLFEKQDKYLGIDLSHAPYVDLVCHAADLPLFFNHLFDCVISVEALEHDALWERTLDRVHRLLRPDGLCILTCAGPKRKEHGTRQSAPMDSPDTLDHYRNLTREDMLNALNVQETFKSYSISYMRDDQDLYFVGRTKK